MRGRDSEIVLICGYNAAGKSTLVKEFTDCGYHRINRDTTGGSLDGQVSLVKAAVADGHRRIVLDNTYLTIESRESVIEAGKELNIPVRCVWLKTSFEDAQLNACLRMVRKTGRILSPEELKKSKDPNLFPPVALFGARKKWKGEDKTLKYKGKQIPKVEHGFYEVEEREFVRSWSKEYHRKALILDFDDTLRKSNGPNNWPEHPDHVELLPGRKEILGDYQKRGYLLLGASNQSAIAKGLPEKDCVACFERTLELLGLKIDYLYCPHRIPPVSCYCRKPSPGMAALFIEKYKLLPSECIFVGDATSDKTFAERAGFQYVHPNEFFK